MVNYVDGSLRIEDGYRNFSMRHTHEVSARNAVIYPNNRSKFTKEEERIIHSIVRTVKSSQDIREYVLGRTLYGVPRTNVHKTNFRKIWPFYRKLTNQFFSGSYNYSLKISERSIFLSLILVFPHSDGRHI
jgi:hypothetical protein